MRLIKHEPFVLLLSLDPTQATLTNKSSAAAHHNEHRLQDTHQVHLSPGTPGRSSLDTTEQRTGKQTTHSSNNLQTKRGKHEHTQLPVTVATDTAQPPQPHPQSTPMYSLDTIANVDIPRWLQLITCL